MFKTGKQQFIDNTLVFESAVELLAESYSNPELTLEKALEKSDTVYYEAENNIVTAIAFSKLYKSHMYNDTYFIYLGLTAKRRNTASGTAFNCVMVCLRDTGKKIGPDKHLYAISTVSSPFSYHGYTKISRTLQPDINGNINSGSKELFASAIKMIFRKTPDAEKSWLLREYAATKYNRQEILRINSYLESKNILLFNPGICNIDKGDRILVFGEVNNEITNAA